jgi:hypothetical protein
MKILKEVNYRKLVSREHLEYIIEEYRNLKSSTRVLNKSLSKLYLKHCLDKCHEEMEYGTGNAPAIYSLDRAGAILLDVPFKPRFVKRENVKNHNLFTVLPSNWKHIQKVNELEIITLKKCFEVGAELIRWDLEEVNRVVIPTNKGNVTLISDVITLINNKNKPMLYFVEFDTGNEDFRYATQFPTLKEKIEKYHTYKISGLWKDKWFARIGFPTIVFVTLDRKRIKYLQSLFSKLQLSAYVLEFEQYEKWLSHYMT